MLKRPGFPNGVDSSWAGYRAEPLRDGAPLLSFPSLPLPLKVTASQPFVRLSRGGYETLRRSKAPFLSLALALDVLRPLDKDVVP